jgi:hypothetical protein
VTAVAVPTRAMLPRATGPCEALISVIGSAALSADCPDVSPQFENSMRPAAIAHRGDPVR